MNNTVPVLNSSRGGSSPSEYPAPFSRSLALAIVIVHASEILVGFPTNLRVCFILYKRKNLRKVPHVLLGNLSLVGALVSAIYIPLRLSINVMDQVLHKPAPGGFCVVAHSSSLLFFGLQTLTLVAMAIDRYDCVVRPFIRRITVTNVHKVVKGIWLVAGLITTLHIIIAVSDYANKYYVSAGRTTTSITFILALANIYLFLTIIIIFTTFLRIVKKLRSSPFAESNQNSEVQVTRFSYMLLFFFVVSWIPLSSFSIVNLLADFTLPEFRGIKALLLAMSNLNYVVNPFIHMNILKAAPRAAAQARSSNEEQEKERPGKAWIEEKSEANEQQLQSGAHNQLTENGVLDQQPVELD